MNEYKFKTIYSKENIKTLSRIQVNTFHWKGLGVAFFNGLLLIVLSATIIGNQQLAVICTAVGCWICISMNYPAQYISKKINHSLRNGERYFTYVFRLDGIEISCGVGKKYVKYCQVQKVIENKDVFCFFLTKQSGFLIEKKQIKEFEELRSFKSLIEKRVNLKIEQEQTLFTRLIKLRFRKRI